MSFKEFGSFRLCCANHLNPNVECLNEVESGYQTTTHCEQSNTKTMSNSLDADSKNKETTWTDDQIRWEGGWDDAPEAPTVDVFHVDHSHQFRFSYHLAPERAIEIVLDGYTDASDEIWKSTGLTVWKAAEYLADYIVKHPSLLAPTSKVLELGAGLGLCGLVAQHLTDQSICITDGDTETLKTLRKNLRANRSRSNVFCQQLLWGKASSQPFLEQHGTFDVILAADVLYAASIIVPLLETIDMLLSETGVFYLCFKKREVPVEAADLLREATAMGFSHRLLSQNEARDVFLYVLRRDKDEK